VDWNTLDATMPELGASNLLKPWRFSTIPRVIKTHKSYWPMFSGRKRVLLIRDPRDVMVSYHHHLTSRKMGSFTGSFSEFIRSERYGLEAWFRHYLSWKDHHTYLMTYEDLKKDDLAEFTRFLAYLGALNDPAQVNRAVEKSRFDRIRAVEQAFGLTKPGEVEEGFLFTRRGTCGDWEGHFTNKDVDYFQKMREKYAVHIY
jgi:hypothetical protein